MTDDNSTSRPSMNVVYMFFNSRITIPQKVFPEVPSEGCEDRSASTFKYNLKTLQNWRFCTNGGQGAIFCANSPFDGLDITFPIQIIYSDVCIKTYTKTKEVDIKELQIISTLTTVKSGKI